MNKKITTSLLTRTAILLAIAVLAQQIRVVLPFLNIPIGPFNLSVLITGALVNLCLLVATFYAGLFGGLSIAFITPLIAFFQGQLPIPQMIFAVAIGNATIVVVFLLLKKQGEIFALLAAAVAKFAVLYVVVQKLVIPVFVSVIEPAEKAAKLSKTLAVSFGVSQLITAAIGALFAYFIIKRLPKDGIGNISQG